MKATKSDKRFLEEGMLESLRLGAVSVPYLLMTSYASLKLSETDVMLLLQLYAFLEKEKKELPTIEEIQARMSAAPEQVIESLQRLMKDGWLAIDEEEDPATGIRGERYNLDGLWTKLAAHWAQSRSVQATASKPAVDRSVFTVFEQEFARPLTPMELETISGWLDQDRFTEELILAALKEAVFAGKVHFRYIDRILLEWQRNRVFTVEQAREYAQKFRGTR